LQGDRRRVQYPARRVVVDDFSLAAEDEAHGSAKADCGQRFKRHVEQQNSPHRTSRWRRTFIWTP
jgi:hypothetical protein